MMLIEGGWRVVWVEIGEKSVFSTFEVNSDVFECVLGTVMEVEGVPVSEDVTDGVCEEKSVVFNVIWPVESKFVVFSFTGGAEDCAVVLDFVDMLDVVGDIVGVSEGLCGKKTGF